MAGAIRLPKRQHDVGKGQDLSDVRHRGLLPASDRVVRHLGVHLGLENHRVLEKRHVFEVELVRLLQVLLGIDRAMLVGLDRLREVLLAIEMVLVMEVDRPREVLCDIIVAEIVLHPGVRLGIDPPVKETAPPCQKAHLNRAKDQNVNHDLMSEALPQKLLQSMKPEKLPKNSKREPKK